MKEKFDIVLQCLIEEYSRERERNGLLESKANYFIAILIGIVMISFSVTPYNNLLILIGAGQRGKALGIFILIGGMILLLILSFYYFMKVLSIKKHAAINVQYIVENTMNIDIDAMRKNIQDHYLKTIAEESNVNDIKAKHLKTAIMLFYISLALIFAVSVVLITCLGG